MSKTYLKEISPAVWRTSEIGTVSVQQLTLDELILYARRVLVVIPIRLTDKTRRAVAANSYCNRKDIRIRQTHSYSFSIAYVKGNGNEAPLFPIECSRLP